MWKIIWSLPCSGLIWHPTSQFPGQLDFTLILGWMKMCPGIVKLINFIFPSYNLLNFMENLFVMTTRMMIQNTHYSGSHSKWAWHCCVSFSDKSCCPKGGKTEEIEAIPSSPTPHNMSHSFNWLGNIIIIPMSGQGSLWWSNSGGLMCTMIERYPLIQRSKYFGHWTPTHVHVFKDYQHLSVMHNSNWGLTNGIGLTNIL